MLTFFANSTFWSRGDFAAGDLPAAGDAPQHVASGPDVKVLLGLGPAAIDHKIRIDFDFACLMSGFHLDIGDQLAGARRQVFSPRHITPGREILIIWQP